MLRACVPTHAPIISVLSPCPPIHPPQPNHPLLSYLQRLFIYQVIYQLTVTIHWLKEKVQKKEEEKLTSVSFAFTHTYIHTYIHIHIHTYTLEKLKMFLLFPQAYRGNFEKCAKTQIQKKHDIVPCYLWLAIGAPCGQDITPYGSKLIFWKIIVHSHYCWEKRKK